MRTSVKRGIIVAATASAGLLTFVGYPAVRGAYSVGQQPSVVDDYVDLPTATADLTKDAFPEGIGTGTDAPIDVSHWLLFSLLKSNNSSRRERALNELARQSRWSDAECVEIAQALGRSDLIKLARTIDADIRLFPRPPTIEHIEALLESTRIEKLVKAILKDVAEKTDSCSSCTNFYNNLSIRVRPDSNVLAMSDLNQVDKMMRIESRKRKKLAYTEDVVRLKAILNNIICGEEQALIMAKSGILVALLYFRHKYPDDLKVNSLLAQILSNLSSSSATRDYVFTEGWVRTLVEYTRNEQLEISLPAFKALANLDNGLNAVYGNHIYLLAPLYRDQESEAQFDVVFVHGLVGSVFKSWRQGRIAIDEFGNRCSPKNFAPTTELLANSGVDDSTMPITATSDTISNDRPLSLIDSPYTRCWPKDWLANDVPGLRIMAVDYPTALSNWRTECDLNKDSLRQRAIHVMKQMESAHLGERPIVWVAHSMGGLLVKQILVLCDEMLTNQVGSPAKLNDSNNYDKQIRTDCDEDNCDSGGGGRGGAGDYVVGAKEASISESNPPFSRNFAKSVAEQTKGIVFYSVPHKGSNLDWIERKNLQKLLQLTTEVIELQKGSPILVDLHERFLNFIKKPQNRNIKFMTFAENAVSSFGVNKVVQWRGVLVHKDSLSFELGPLYELNIDHAHTCKPHSKEALTYRKTMEFIQDLMPANLSKLQSDEELMPFISFVV